MCLTQAFLSAVLQLYMVANDLQSRLPGDIVLVWCCTNPWSCSETLSVGGGMRKEVGMSLSPIHMLYCRYFVSLWSTPNASPLSWFFCSYTILLSFPFYKADRRMQKKFKCRFASVFASTLTSRRNNRRKKSIYYLIIEVSCGNQTLYSQ